MSSLSMVAAIALAAATDAPALPAHAISAGVGYFQYESRDRVLLGAGGRVAYRRVLRGPFSAQVEARFFSGTGRAVALAAGGAYSVVIGRWAPEVSLLLSAWTGEQLRIVRSGAPLASPVTVAAEGWLSALRFGTPAARFSVASLGAGVGVDGGIVIGCTLFELTLLL